MKLDYSSDTSGPLTAAGYGIFMVLLILVILL